MGRRRAVAATLVSLIVFSSLLVANSALYSSDQGALGAAVLSAAQTRERTLGGVLAGLAAYGALEEVQGELARTALDCSSPQAYLDSLAGGSSASGSQEGISYSTAAEWAYAPSPPAVAGAALMRGFGGYSPGEVDLLVSGSLDESYRGGLPSYSLELDQAVHLPVPLSSTVADCQEALADVRVSLAALPPPCNSSSVEEAVRLAESTYYSVLGPFQVNATATAAGSGCAVGYAVTTTLVGLEGPSGPFGMTFQGEGSLVT